jgi:L-ascorbate metabolism protein UlaG (beta-lactamase superfamily)
MKRLAFSLLILAAASLAAGCRGDGEEATPIAGNAATPSMKPAPGQIRITYYGHSMFAIESPGAIVILTDPNKDIGYATPDEDVDIVTVSHDHFDHNKVELAPGAPVLRGLTEDGDWAEIDEAIGDVRIRTVPTFHDDQEGAERGKNAMFVFEIGDWRVVHAGDLGHADVSFETLEDPGSAFRPDILMLPVGGHFTIGPFEAGEVIAQLRPARAVPIHYGTEALTNLPDADELRSLQDFLEAKGEATVGGPCLAPGSGTTLVMDRSGMLLDDPRTTIVLMCP